MKKLLVFALVVLFANLLNPTPSQAFRICYPKSEHFILLSRGVYVDGFTKNQNCGETVLYNDRPIQSDFERIVGMITEIQPSGIYKISSECFSLSDPNCTYANITKISSNPSTSEFASLKTIAEKSIKQQQLANKLKDVPLIIGVVIFHAVILIWPWLLFRKNKHRTLFFIIGILIQLLFTLPLLVLAIARTSYYSRIPISLTLFFWFEILLFIATIIFEIAYLIKNKPKTLKS